MKVWVWMVLLALAPACDEAAGRADAAVDSGGSDASSDTSDAVPDSSDSGARPGPSVASALVAGGGQSASARYQLVMSSGQASPASGTLRSSHFVLSAGLISTMTNPEDAR